jgi:hypothetical protein
MYKIQTIIPGLKNVPSYISELAFNPTGSILGATFSQFDNNCGVLDNSVRLYDTKSTKIIKELRNPLSQLNQPHAILLTNKHIILSNKGTSPSNLLTFRIKDKTNLPSDNYITPYKKLNEAHSFAIFNQLLLVTYCEIMDKKEIKINPLILKQIESLKNSLSKNNIPVEKIINLYTVLA